MDLAQPVVMVLILGSAPVCGTNQRDMSKKPKKNARTKRALSY